MALVVCTAPYIGTITAYSRTDAITANNKTPPIPVTVLMIAVKIAHTNKRPIVAELTPIYCAASK